MLSATRWPVAFGEPGGPESLTENRTFPVSKAAMAPLFILTRNGCASTCASVKHFVWNRTTVQTHGKVQDQWVVPSRQARCYAGGITKPWSLQLKPFFFLCSLVSSQQHWHLSRGSETLSAPFHPPSKTENSLDRHANRAPPRVTYTEGSQKRKASTH